MTCSSMAAKIISGVRSLRKNVIIESPVVRNFFQTDAHCFKSENTKVENLKLELKRLKNAQKPTATKRTIKDFKVIKNIKKFQWENVNLYGPVLTAAKQKRLNQENEPEVDKVTEEGECSGFVSGGEKKVKVWFAESGYGIEDSDKQDFKAKVKDTLIEFKHVDIYTTKASQVNISVANTENSLNDKHNHLKNECSLWNLDGFPLCIGDKKDALTAQFTSFCKQVLSVKNPSSLSFASVTSILQKSMSEESRIALENWENMMIEKLSFDGFQKYKQEMFAVGRILHKEIENRLSGQIVVEESLDERVKGYWKSVKHVFKDIGNIQLLETKVEHPYLRYKGILDCVAKYRDMDVVIEWKTSQRPRLSLKDIYDNPLQVAAYAGALNCTQPSTQQINRGVVVIAYASGSPAHLHYLNQTVMEHYWRMWLQRLEKYLKQS